MYGRKEAPISLGSVAVGGDKEPENKKTENEESTKLPLIQTHTDSHVRTLSCPHYTANSG